MGARRFAILVVVTVLAACGGRGEENADEPDCPTTTGPQPTATTTIDPRCVTRATETSDGAEDEAIGQDWKGAVSGTFQFPNCTAGTVSGDVAIAVRADGSLSGRVDSTVSPTICGGVRVGEQRVGVAVVGGNKSDQAFHIQFNDGSVADLVIKGNQATGALKQPGPNAEFVYLGNANGRTDIALEETQ